MVTCDTCGAECIPTDYTAGYGTDREGRKLCFACCGKLDAQNMRETGRAILYLTCEPAHLLKSPTGRKRAGTVANWPGTLKIPCHTSAGRHNIAQWRYDVWFTFEGERWYGRCIGDNTQICHCRRVKR